MKITSFLRLVVEQFIGQRRVMRIPKRPGRMPKLLADGHERDRLLRRLPDSGVIASGGSASAKLSCGAVIWGFGCAGGSVDLDELFGLGSLQQSHAHVLAKGPLDFRELSG